MSPEISDTDRLYWLIKNSNHRQVDGVIQMIVPSQYCDKKGPNPKKVREAIDEEIRNEVYEI
mgnify:CR=1 FL=1